MTTLAEHDAATRHSDGLWHTDDCLFAQDVGPCTCGRAEAERAADRAWRKARPLVVAALEAAEELETFWTNGIGWFDGAIPGHSAMETQDNERMEALAARCRAALDALREKGLL